MDTPEDLDELEGIGPIPMTPLNTIPPTPTSTVNSDYPVSPNAATLESLFAPPRRQRTASSVEDASRQRSGSFDSHVEGDLEELWETFDRSERQRSESIMLLENLPDVSDVSAIIAASQGVSGGGQEAPSLTVTQAAQMTLTQTRGPDGNLVSTSMPPPPLPVRSARGRQIRSGQGHMRLSATRRFLTSSYLATDEESLALIPGKCTPEERRIKIDKYIRKRSRRVWEKTIKYSVRKQFAESRPRVGGRFIPKPASQAAQYASQLAQMGKLEQKLDRRVIFSILREDADDVFPDAAYSSLSDDDSSADEHEISQRKRPLVDFSKDSLVMPKVITKVSPAPIVSEEKGHVQVESMSQEGGNIAATTMPGSLFKVTVE